MLRDAANATIVLPYNDADAVEHYIKQNPGQVAAIIVEPIAHNVGAMRATDDFLRGLRRIATENGVILIFDEVITGFRHALGGYQSICGVTPDLATFGKAAAAGYPIGLVAGKRDILERVGRTGRDAVFMGGTFNGTPSTLAAMIATIEQLSLPGVYDRLFEMGNYLRSELDCMIDRLGLPAQSAGFGSIWLVYFFKGRYSRYEDLLRNDDVLDTEFRRQMVAHRYIFQPLAMKRLYLNLAHDRPIIDRALEVIETILRSLTAGHVRTAPAAVSSS